MKFEKIDRDQFRRDFLDSYLYGNLARAVDKIEKVENRDLRARNLADMIWDKLVLPKRGTIGSAAYDFFFPLEMRLDPGVTIDIPTGVAWNVSNEKNDNFVLFIFSRSSIGIRYNIIQPNLVSVIDKDYYGCAKNGGHIHIHLQNTGSDMAILHANTGYAQGVITKFYLTEDDETTAIRTGGFGSTDLVLK